MGLDQNRRAIHPRISQRAIGARGSAVDTRRYRSVSNVVGDAMQRLKDENQAQSFEIEEFRAENDRRLASLDRGESVDGEEFFWALRRRFVLRRWAAQDLEGIRGVIADDVLRAADRLRATAPFSHIPGKQ